MFPENIIQATFQQVQTKYVTVTQKVIKKNMIPGITDYTKPTTEYTSGMNCLGVIVFSIGVGVVMSQMGEEASVLIEFFKALDKVIMTLVGYVMM